MDSQELNIISKTELKKDSKKIQALGRSIAEMSTDEIKKFNFPLNIQQAITEFKAIKSIHTICRHFILLLPCTVCSE